MALFSLFGCFLVALFIVGQVFEASAADGELEFNYLPIAHVRTDPIINQTCLSDHVHTYYGPPKVRPEVTTDDLLATNPADHSGLVEENKSLYWHPSIYQYNSVTGIYTLAPIHYTSVYYFWETSEDTKPFPKGFRMIASDEYAFTECVDGDFYDCSRPDGCGSENSFFPDRACKMLEVTMDFPSCWNGDNDSDDHKSHVSHRNEDDECPSTHPLIIPTVSISIYFANYEGGWYTFSDSTGVDFHADYLAGWEPSVLQDVFDKCALDVEECASWVTFKGNGEPTGCDSHDQKRAKLLAIQPDPLDTSTITTEAVNGVSTLPMGLCTGELLGGTSTTTPSPTKSPTPRPTQHPTLKPTQHPTLNPTSPPMGPTPSSAPRDVMISIFTDANFGETSFVVKNGDTKEKVGQGGGFGDDEEWFDTMLSLAPGNYRLILKDTEGNGFCCEDGEGRWQIHLEDEIIQGKGNFGARKRVDFVVS